MTVEENLNFYGKLFGITDLEDRIASRLRRVGLSERARSEVRKLSHGMRQRASLARALLHDPDLVMLDEPYSGLDPAAALVLRDVLEELKDGRRTVVMVTHNLREGLEMATRIAIQVGGRFEWEGSLKGARWEDFESHYLLCCGRSGVNTYLTQVWAILRKDLVLEIRSRERIGAMCAFAVLTGVLFNFSIDTTTVRPNEVATGLIWMTLIFGGLLGVGRTFHLESHRRRTAGYTHVSSS
jgi:ABC-type multidrug transport system, ATPase component